MEEEYEDFRSNVVPPRARPTFGRVLGSVLMALVVVAGLVGALLLAGPALDAEQQPAPDGPEAAEDR